MKKFLLKSLMIIVFVFMLFPLISCASYDYTVKYYNELTDGSYAEMNIERLTTTEEVFKFEPAEVEHYSVNLSKSKLTGDFTTSESVLIEVYYDANRYTVTFDIGALEYVSGDLSQKVFYGESAIAPVVKSSDMASFKNWNISFDKVESDLTVKAVCDTDAKVKVIQKFENLDGTYTTSELETVTIDASLGEYTYVPKEIEHYVLNSNLSELSCIPSVANEKTVVVCYDRKEYTVTFDINGLTLVNGELTQTVKYGENAVYPVVSNNSKSEFISWDKTVNNIDSDLKVTAVVNNDAKVLINIYKENLNGGYDKEESKISVNALEGEYTYKVSDIDHYVFNEDKSSLSVIPTLENMQVVNVYYDRMIYTVKFNLNGLDLASGDLEQSVKYGDKATAPSVNNNDSCRFVKWDKDYSNVESNMTINAEVSTEAEVNVITYKENLNGEYVLDSEEKIYVDTVNGNYTHKVKEVQNYVINLDKCNLTITPSILNIQTISVYYDLARFNVEFNIGNLTHSSGELKQVIPYGGSALAPVVSDTRTAAFKNWDKAFDKVTSDLVIYAVCTTDAKVLVVSYFENITGGYSKGDEQSLTVSALPEKYTYTPVPLNEYNVNETLGNNSCPLTAGKEEVINIYYDLKRYTVSFECGDLTLVSGEKVQTVPHGGSAIAPVVADTQTVKFNKWDISFDKVTSDLNVNAILDVYKPISTRADLECIALDLNANYILVNNINLNSANWTPLGTFTGKLNGNGFTLECIKFDGQNDVGLFTNNKGVIENIIFKDCTATFNLGNVNAWEIRNSFVANTNEGVIKNCKMTGSNVFNYSFSASADVGCYSDSAFTHFNWSNTFKAGTFTCFNLGTIENCTIEGSTTFNVTTNLYYKFNTWLYTNVGSGSFTITSNGVFGGFCAENSGNIEGCVSSANIKLYEYTKATSETSGMGRNDVYAYTKAYFGTICGTNKNSINGCRTLVGTLDTGGKSTNCEEAHAQNSVTSDNSYKGLIGSNAGTISNSVATTS